ncbi:MAG TPA: asparagine synthase-related protein [Candidatus Binataceae bacterium]|nr:asparagine synthase-related protein [Candidatus Binataceae bacterium]
MSGIAAFYRRTGEAVEPPVIDRMLDALAHRGPDARGAWCRDAVGMGQVALHATPEALCERQPLHSAEGEVSLVFDGRLDNREELRASLAAVAIMPRDDSDAELVLGAYRRWGPECAAQLLGDFALALWDGARRQWFCARDILGVKPLCYFADHQLFLCASEIPALFAAGLPVPEPNEGLVGEYLSDCVSSRAETLYQNIFRLPPAHYLIVGARSLHLQRYFELDPGRRLRYRSDREYADHFRVVLETAIRCRLRSHRPIAVYLSGGLDSSSIVGLMADMQHDGRGTGTGFRTFSMVNPGQAGDESCYIRAVLDHWKLEGELQLPATPSGDYFTQQARQRHDVPEFPNISGALGLAQAALHSGSRVVLTGLGGDDWLCAYYTHCADLLLRGHLRELWRQLRVEADSASWWRRVDALVRRGLWPLTPRALRGPLDRLRLPGTWPPFLRRDFGARIDLASRMAMPSGARRRQWPADWELHQWFGHGNMIRANEADDLHHAALGLEARHPFHDRRLIEFALALPEEQRWRGVQTKFILRQAMGSRLPTAVGERLDKGDYSATIAQALEACGGAACFQKMQSASRGWVDEAGARALYQAMRAQWSRGDLGYASKASRLWSLWAIELWLREGRGGSTLEAKGIPS